VADVLEYWSIREGIFVTKFWTWVKKSSGGSRARPPMRK